MLHDPSHKPVMPVEEEIHISAGEREILRGLGHRIAEIAAEPANERRRRLWRDLNDLQSRRPMVWINEVPWHEMNVDDQLTLRCQGAWARELEDRLRKTIYQWDHLQGDMVVDAHIECPTVFHSTDFGILEDVDIAKTDDANDIVSRHFKIQISEPEDIDKIQLPKITYLPAATQYARQATESIFEGILPVKMVGQTHIWYTPWDFLIRWWGVEEAMTDLVERPEMVHDAYERMVQAWMVELDQLEAQNLLSLDCNNTRIGSGGYGYVSDLPGDAFDPDHVRPENMWGCANAQIFSGVSPDMHWEFALEHDQKWLRRWGLTYYGCCEPLDNKIHLLRRIPNLRKLSASPWCNTARLVEAVGADYVMSRKPNPAIFVDKVLDEARAERELREFLDAARGCHVELIMKDISTVAYTPGNLWRWAEIAARVAEDYSN